MKMPTGQTNSEGSEMNCFAFTVQLFKMCVRILSNEFRCDLQRDVCDLKRRAASLGRDPKSSEKQHPWIQDVKGAEKLKQAKRMLDSPVAKLILSEFVSLVKTQISSRCHAPN